MIQVLVEGLKFTTPMHFIGLPRRGDIIIYREAEYRVVKVVHRADDPPYGRASIKLVVEVV